VGGLQSEGNMYLLERIIFWVLPSIKDMPSIKDNISLLLCSGLAYVSSESNSFLTVES